MISFQELIRPIIRKLKENIILVVLGVILLSVTLWAFSDDSKKSEGFQVDRPLFDTVFRFFYVDWCPHCQDSKPEWEKFVRQCPKTIGNHRIRCEAINCENNPDMAKTYQVQSYPTFILETDGMKTEYSGDRNASSFLSWVRSQAKVN